MRGILRLWAGAGLGAALAMLSVQTGAAAPSKVYSPHVEKGELEIEHRGIVDKDGDPDKDGALTIKDGFGYGIADWWFAEAYAEHEREAGEDLELVAVEVESIFRLTEPGEYWADLGFLAEYAFSTKGGTDEVELGPLIEKQIGRTVHTANVIFSKEIGDGAEDVMLEYAWASRWRLSPYFQPGFEAFGEFGEIGDFPALRDQEHKIGPAAIGTVPLGNGAGKLHYEAAYLFGLTDETPDGAFRWLLEYELRF